jgi:hypothetical protein
VFKLNLTGIIIGLVSKEVFAEVNRLKHEMDEQAKKN